MKDDPVLKIIEKSGNGFHLKVAKHLESLDWEVTVGQYYADPVSEKPREIDIYARKRFRIGDSEEKLTVRLFIECKYVPDENVLWFVKKDMKKAKALVSENQVFRDCTDQQLMVMEDFKTKPHHYLTGGEVAKLNAKTGNTDIIYDGMNGSLHGLIALEHHEYQSYQLNYPMIVLNSFDKVFKATGDDTNPYEKIEDNFQLGADYSYMVKDHQVNKYFLIDIVSFDQIDAFLGELRKTDVQIAQDVVIGRINESRWNARFNQEGNDDFDPYSAV